MNILIITDLFPTQNDPSHGVFIFQWVQYLSNKNNITLYQIVWSNEKIKKLDTCLLFKTLSNQKLTFNWIQKKCNYFPIDRLWIRCLQFYQKIKKEKKINIKTYDLIIGQMGCPGGFVATKLGKNYKIPSIVGVRGSDVHDYLEIPILKHLATWTYKNCNHIITVSDSLKEKLIASGIQQNKITTICNGINPLFKPLDKETNKKKLDIPLNKRIILFVGYLIDRKGVKYLIKAIEKLNDKNLLLYIIGDGEKKAKLKKQVHDSGLEKKVHFLGNIMQKDLLFWYNAADVLCLPSLREGIPNVMLESLACGTPVITTDISNNADIINDTNGFLVQPKDIEQLKETIIKSLQIDWNIDVIKDSIENFQWEQNCSQYNQLLSKMC